MPTETPVFDCTVPREWNIRDAWIKDSRGRKVVDFQQSSLHVLNYSTPVHAVLPLSALKPHLFTLPEHSDWTAVLLPGELGDLACHTTRLPVPSAASGRRRWLYVVLRAAGAV